MKFLIKMLLAWLLLGGVSACGQERPKKPLNTAQALVKCLKEGTCRGTIVTHFVDGGVNRFIQLGDDVTSVKFTLLPNGSLEIWCVIGTTSEVTMTYTGTDGFAEHIIEVNKDEQLALIYRRSDSPEDYLRVWRLQSEMLKLARETILPRELISSLTAEK